VPKKSSALPIKSSVLDAPKSIRSRQNNPLRTTRASRVQYDSAGLFFGPDGKTDLKNQTDFSVKSHLRAALNIQTT
jgi:hypothetical protein